MLDHPFTASTSIAGLTPFTYTGLPTEVVFGSGTIARLPSVVERHGGRRVLLLTTPEQAQQARDLLVPLLPAIVGHFDRAVMHTPVEVTEQALEAARGCGADLLLAFGGGSTIGLGKALALRTGTPQVAVPTTYAGSEMTPILGQTANQRKTTLRDLAVLPRAVLYDVDLTLALPPIQSGASGLNAMAHAVEGLYAGNGNPIVQLIAADAVRALARALPAIARNGADVSARTDALYGAWLAGMILGTTEMGLHHKLCHILGGAFDLPHAQTHAIVLPHVLAYNATSAPAAMDVLRAGFGQDDPAAALFRLGGAMGLPQALRDIGMPRSGIDLTVDLAVAQPYGNPRRPEPAALRDLVMAAWIGRAPEGTGKEGVDDAR